MIPSAVRSRSRSMAMFVFAVPVRLTYSTSAAFGSNVAASMTTWRRLLVAGDWTATRGEKFVSSVKNPSKLKSGFESASRPSRSP